VKDQPKVMSPTDIEVLERIVGSATFARGAGYARIGAVRNRIWSSAGTHLIGEIQGGAPKPYVANVILTRTKSNDLSAFEATCTCPVGVNCKHAVALVLADESARPHQVPKLRLVGDDSGRNLPTPSQGPKRDSIQSRNRESPPTDWQLPLRNLLEPDEGEIEEHNDIDIGLQFELTLDPKGAGIRVRPVTPGRNGNWVRTGISWDNLDYYRYGAYGARRTPRAAERLLLVKEILALSRLANRGYTFGYPNDVVRLETINSRRLWDLFGEAKTLGLPLLQAGRGSRPITILSKPASGSSHASDLGVIPFRSSSPCSSGVQRTASHGGTNRLVNPPGHSHSDSERSPRQWMTNYAPSLGPRHSMFLAMMKSGC
jgi:hypothetical protein